MCFWRPVGTSPFTCNLHFKAWFVLATCQERSVLAADYHFQTSDCWRMKLYDAQNLLYVCKHGQMATKASSQDHMILRLVAGWGGVEGVLFVTACLDKWFLVRAQATWSQARSCIEYTESSRGQWDSVPCCRCWEETSAGGELPKFFFQLLTRQKKTWASSLILLSSLVQRGPP